MSCEGCGEKDVQRSSSASRRGGQSRSSDCGYGSEAEGCDHCSSPSSNDGSDICSDGLCMHDGERTFCLCNIKPGDMGGNVMETRNTGFHLELDYELNLG